MLLVLPQLRARGLLGAADRLGHLGGLGGGCRLELGLELGHLAAQRARLLGGARAVLVGLDARRLGRVAQLRDLRLERRLGVGEGRGGGLLGVERVLEPGGLVLGSGGARLGGLEAGPQRRERRGLGLGGAELLGLGGERRGGAVARLRQVALEAGNLAVGARARLARVAALGGQLRAHAVGVGARGVALALELLGARRRRLGVLAARGLGAVGARLVRLRGALGRLEVAAQLGELRAQVGGAALAGGARVLGRALGRLELGGECGQRAALLAQVGAERRDAGALW